MKAGKPRNVGQGAMLLVIDCCYPFLVCDQRNVVLPYFAFIQDLKGIHRYRDNSSLTLNAMPAYPLRPHLRT